MPKIQHMLINNNSKIHSNQPHLRDMQITGAKQAYNVVFLKIILIVDKNLIVSITYLIVTLTSLSSLKL